MGCGAGAVSSVLDADFSAVEPLGGSVDASDALPDSVGCCDDGGLEVVVIGLGGLGDETALNSRSASSSSTKSSCCCSSSATCAA